MLMRALFFLSTIVSFAALARPTTMAVYDGDHRVDIYEVKDPSILKLADSTVAMFFTSNLEPARGGFNVSQEPMEKTLGVCRDEKFANEPTAADCSGVLIGPSRILTAGHCVTRKTCAQTAFVFGYRMADAKTTTTHFPVESVYYCSQIAARSNTDSLDYAVVDLDRSVIGRTPVPVASHDVDVDDEVFLLSHPSGTPLKFSVPVKITESTKNHFTAPLDALGGSSGGPVFSREKNELVGVLVSGEKDYILDRENSCLRINNCKSGECDGEDSTHIGAILNGIKLRTDLPTFVDR